MQIGTVTIPKMDDTEIAPGIWLIGEPSPVVGTNKLRCLANVKGSLCVVELAMKFENTKNVKWLVNNMTSNIKCVSCGRYIPHEDMLGYGKPGKKVAARYTYEPDSHFGPEISEWECRACVEREALTCR